MALKVEGQNNRDVRKEWTYLHLPEIAEGMSIRSKWVSARQFISMTK